MKKYSTRERVACAILGLIFLLGALFWTYLLVTGSGFRGSFSAWVAGVGFWLAVAICLKITVTGRSTARLEQNAADALAGRPLPREPKGPD